MYRGSYLALTLMGPAQLDEDHDPLEALKRKYGKDEASRACGLCVP